MSRPLTAGLLRRGGNPGTKGKLLAKSIEAYLLALETINRLTITYRIETFCALLCNAWELLLKAKLIEDSKSRLAIYYSKEPGKRRRSLSLRDALKAIYVDERDSKRRNIERVEELRDEAIHLFISDLPKDILGLLQASVLNYYEALSDWFGVVLSERVPVGMMTIVFDISPEQLDLSSPVMRRRLGKDAADYLLTLSDELAAEHAELGGSSAFSVQIEYGLSIQRKPDGASVIAITGEDGASVRKVRVPRDPGTDFPFRQTEVVEELRNRLAGISLNTYDIQVISALHNVKKRPEWFYQGTVKGSPGQYSRAFIDWLVSQARRDPKFFEKARQKLRRRTLHAAAAG